MSFLIIILTILGALFGMFTRGLEGLLVFGLSGFLLGMVVSLRSRISGLEHDLAALRDMTAEKIEPVAAVETAAAVEEKPAGPPAKPPPVAPPPVLTEEVKDLEADLAFEFETALEVPSGPPPLPPRPETWTTKIINRSRSFFTTANLVLGFGIIVLFFGVAFLLKYAVEHGLLPLELRYLGAGLLGLVLLVLGWRLREKRRDYALVVQGGAVGILYITVFSAARWHELLPLPLAFAIMVALVLLTGFLAVGQNARGMASYAAAGGFLAPVLTSTGGGHHVLLFSYYALLSVGILGVAIFKTWRELNLIGFTFTLGIGSAWGVNYYRPELFFSTEPFLIFFFLLYLTVSILYALRQPPDLKGLVDSTLVFGLPLAAFTLQAGLIRNMEYGLAASALALSCMYIILTGMLWRYRPEFMKLLTEAFLALGVVFGSLVMPLALDGRWTAAAWAMEGAALVWVGVRQDRLPARCFGLFLQICAGVSFLSALGEPSGNVPVFNSAALGLYIISLAGLFSSFYLKRHDRRLRSWEGFFHIVFLIWGLLWWYGAGLREIDRFIAWRYQLNAFIGYLTFSALIMYLLIKRLEWPALIYPMFLLLPVLVLICMIYTLDNFPRHPFRRYGYLAWTLALAGHYLLLWRSEEGLPGWWRRLLHLAGLWLATFLLTWEAAWAANRAAGGAGVWWFAAWGLGPGLLVQLLLTWGEKVSWPVKKYLDDYQGIGISVLLAVIWLWLLGGSLSNAGDPWPLIYIPFLNPLELSQLFALEVMFLWFWRLRQARIRLPVELPERFPPYFLAGTCFIVANGIIARSVHYWVQVPFEVRALLDNIQFQASLSIFWTCLSLSVMVIATRKSRREVWFAGATLLGVVVLKLFLVDLSQTGTIARIISFLVVGILMLLIGYLSPLPPRTGQEVGK